MELGKWDMRELARLSDELENYDKYIERNLRLMSRNAAGNNNQGIVTIADFDGFTMRNFASSKGN